jgi:hypothetical protein
MAVLVPQEIQPGKFMLHVHQVAIPDFKDVVDAQGEKIGKEKTPEIPRD